MCIREIYNIINSLTVGTFKEKVVNQEDFIVYVGRPTCGDCNNFELDLIQLIQKYDMQDKLAYLNVAQLKKDKVAWKVFKSTYDIQYTPTLAKFEKGQLVNKVEWTPEKGISIQKVDSWIVNHI
uniref:Uncharacterized protein n=1 Tax=Candidatus Enterococcus mansonii TaxID=1834181 RepID=A0A242CFI0_9ENTE|nr:thioredoxin family protein [Enterococcus sp. 4G2_DIV0659]OTO08680.1 hypothetical protein A5880_001680 [Enterococcus sp. 4G2_DIV0659]